MYLKSGVDYYLVNLDGIVIVCKSGESILSPNFKIKLLSYPDINKVNMMLASGMKESDVNEEVVKKCLISIIGFENEELDIDQSPAGVIDHLATKIRLNSTMVIEDIEKSFEILHQSCSIYERIALVVSHFTNQTYDYCKELPIDELVKRYALCSIAFPSQAPALVFEVEEESKVG